MVIERYRDSEPAIQHAENVGHLLPAILATVSWFTASCSVSRTQSS